jgi:hypothetical protein
MKKNLRTPKFVAYRSRGTKENISPECRVCGVTLQRKVTRSGAYEGWYEFLKRKTCGRLSNGRMSECLRKSIMAEGNPKWRGGLPICKDCGKRTGWYKSKQSPQNYCSDCFLKRLHEINKQQGILRRGIYPECLKPFAFIKGVPSPKKIYTEDTKCMYCDRKPIAHWLCKRHYQTLPKFL